MKKDDNYQAPTVPLSSPLAENESIERAEHESIEREDGSLNYDMGSLPCPASIGGTPAGAANTDTLPADNFPADNFPSDNLHREQQQQADAQEIDNIHTYAQGKSASILGEAISKLVNDLKNKRFENKKPSRK
jgi:hypothetical protein